MCDRRDGHGGRHRARYSERMHGADVAGQFDAKIRGGLVRWRRHKDRRA